MDSIIAKIETCSFRFADEKELQEGIVLAIRPVFWWGDWAVAAMVEVKERTGPCRVLADIVHVSPKELYGIMYLVVTSDVGNESLGEEEMAEAGWVRSA